VQKNFRLIKGNSFQYFFYSCAGLTEQRAGINANKRTNAKQIYKTIKKKVYENTYYNKIKKLKCLNITIIIIIIINVQWLWRNLPAHSGTSLRHASFKFDLLLSNKFKFGLEEFSIYSPITKYFISRNRV